MFNKPYRKAVKAYLDDEGIFMMLREEAFRSRRSISQMINYLLKERYKPAIEATEKKSIPEKKDAANPVISKVPPLYPAWSGDKTTDFENQLSRKGKEFNLL